MSDSSKYYKVKISPQKSDFINDLLVFLNRKSSHFRRESAISQILEKNTQHDILKKLSPIILEEVFGSTYQSSFRTNDKIYAISHDVLKICVENDNYFGIISPSPYGEIIDFEKGVLKPVWYQNDEGKFLIATFDIDFNISSDVT